MIYEFAATQDLHGYSEPWAPGEGKNKIYFPAYSADDYLLFQQSTDPVIDVANQTITLNCVGAGQTIILFKHDFTPGQYAISFNVTNYLKRIIIRCYDAEGKQLTNEDVSVTNGTWNAFYRGWYLTSSTFIVPNDVDHFWIGLGVTDDVRDTKVVLSEIQLELGDTATSYTPSSNVCLPEGFNIWDPDNDEFVQVYAGYVNANTRELYLRPVYKEYAGEELVGPWMSSLDPYAEDTTPTEGAFVIDFGGELTSFEITPFMLQTLLDSLGIRQHFTDGAGLLNSLMDQAQGRVRSEEELLHLSRPLKVIPIGDQLPAGLTFKPISKDVLPGLPGKFIR